jgi:hypothetical protein
VTQAQIGHSSDKPKSIKWSEGGSILEEDAPAQRIKWRGGDWGVGGSGTRGGRIGGEEVREIPRG